MSKRRILVFGYSDVGHACLKFLLDRQENVVGVFTHADNPDEKKWFPSVGELADKQGVPVWKVEQIDLGKNIVTIQTLKPDLIFSFYYRFMIPNPILEIPPLGAYNMHGSLLPKYRGRAPVNWAVLKGESETGATLHVMTAKADAGDIVDSESVPIGPNDTSAEVQARVTQAAVTVLSRQIENLKEGKIALKPQDHSQATKFGRRCAQDGEINWNQSAQDIHNLVRAVTHPYPGAFTNIFGAKTFIWSSLLSDTSANSEKPGSFHLVDKQLIVFCGDGKGLQVLKAQNEGSHEQDGFHFFKDFSKNKKEVSI